jgi:hypothetical protein
MTVPHTTTLEGRNEPWLNFDGLVVGRNSDFRTETLTSEQIKDIGGTEYMALGLLSWLVPLVGFSFGRDLGKGLIDDAVVCCCSPGDWIFGICAVVTGDDKIRCGISSAASPYPESLVRISLSIPVCLLMCDAYLLYYVTRFSVFQVTSAYTGTGLSLMDL